MLEIDKERPTCCEGGRMKTYSHNTNGNNAKHQENSVLKSLDFAAINRTALSNALPILQRWLPDGKLLGREYTARNPKRADKKAGSFRVNISTGKWADFACGVRGGDLIALTAYLFDLSQIEAAKRISEMLAIGGGYGK